MAGVAGMEGAEGSSPGSELPGAAALEARVAALEEALAGEEAGLARAGERVARAKAELASSTSALAAREVRVASRGAEAAEAKRQLALLRATEAAKQDPNWRDWAGLPEDLLEKVAGALVAQTEAGWAARLKEDPDWEEFGIQREMAKRKRDGNCLLVVALVCKPWRKAQLKVGAPLCTRVWSDVILPGSVALAKWALAEGCPRADERGYTMANAAAQQGQLELVKWLCGEGGFAMDEWVMEYAASSGNLELVQWLRGEGCPWDMETCYEAVDKGHVEVLRWARENGCPWRAYTRDRAAAELRYRDDFGNVVDDWGNPVE